MVAFPALWIFAAAVDQVRLFDVQRPWSRAMWVVVVMVPLVFVCGGLLASEAVRSKVPRLRTRPAREAHPTRRLRRLLLLFVLLGFAELVHQWGVARAVPLLSSNIDHARSIQPGGPTIVLTDLLTVAAVVALVLPKKLFSREALPELGIAALAFSAFALQAGRSSFILPTAVAFFARGFYRGFPKPETIAILVAVLLVAASSLFFLRSRQHATAPFEHEVFTKVVPETPWPLRPLIPVHIALGLNFEALARIVDYFPTTAPFGHWRYDLKLFDAVVPDTGDIAQLSARESSPIITSTLAGTFWADYGYVGVMVGVALVAALSTAVYQLARRTVELRFVLPAAYLLYLTLFGIYLNLFTEFPDWLIVTPLLFACGWLAEDRPLPDFLRR